MRVLAAATAHGVEAHHLRHPLKYSPNDMLALVRLDLSYSTSCMSLFSSRFICLSISSDSICWRSASLLARDDALDDGARRLSPVAAAKSSELHEGGGDCSQGGLLATAARC